MNSVRRGPSGPRGEKRERILTAAHAAFTELDYKHATYREIARRAGVDPALIAYYFRSKAHLLRESLALPGRSQAIDDSGVGGGSSRRNRTPFGCHHFEYLGTSRYGGNSGDTV
ncbi:TetR/AcrR family transcriptional regulator [Mobiluncus curtisii]|uniref:TetR/AcrR family transcriptional regulator n=1 Tax=Mobiluncus curtisii TaxID=2051 RepID=UPI001F2FBB6E|nr:TetR/AcrR family transcriptional regulator [Mobiluncus curtisii]